MLPRCNHCAWHHAVRLHAQYDEEAVGVIQYKELMKDLLEPDQLALYAKP